MGSQQELLAFTFQEIADRPGVTAAHRRIAHGVEARMAEPVRSALTRAGPVTPMTSDAVAGRRLIVLLFDISSMQPEDVQRSVDSARTFVKIRWRRRSVAVATLPRRSTSHRLHRRTRARRPPRSAARVHRGARHRGSGRRTVATDEAAAAAEEAATTEASDSTCNNDVRLRALRTLAETLSPIEQKKAMSISAPACSGAARTIWSSCGRRSCVGRAHVAIYPIDVRGLQALVPAATPARRADGPGHVLGRGMAQQFASASSQDTLTSWRARPGGAPSPIE